MFRIANTILNCSTLALFFASVALSKDADEVPKLPSVPPIDTVVRSVIETVLKHHIEPPTRQQMVLELIRSVAKHKRNALNADLSVTISDFHHADQIYDLLAIELQKQGMSLEPAQSDFELVKAAFRDLVPGGLEITSQSAALAEAQIAANRYVGIGVQIGGSGKGNGHQFQGVFPEGPAADAGIFKLDVLEAIDGKSTMEWSLQEVIQGLRGPEKTEVVLTVRTADQPARDLTLIRRVVPIKSALLTEKTSDGEALQIRLERIAASSLNEIQKIISDSEASSNQVKTIVLDLRQTQSENLHFLHLFADGILDETTFGIVKTRTTSRTLKTEEGTTFGKRKIALLYTPGFSDRLDLLALVATQSGVPVYHTDGLDYSQPPKAASLRPILSDFPAEGMEYVIQLTATALLNSNGEQIPSAPVGKTMQERLPNLGDFFAANTKRETDLQSIVRDLQ